MNFYSFVVACVLFFISGCATNFSSHLDASVKSGEVSELGLAKSFIILDTDSSSRKINYSYGKLFPYAFGVMGIAFESYALRKNGVFRQPENTVMNDSDYAEYTKNREVVNNSATKEMLAKRLAAIGMAQDKGGGKATLLLSYEELIGWDMGEIVKEMRICGRVDPLPGRYMDCVEFSEMKMANTHPTRELVVNNLVALLLSKNWPKSAPADKYRKVQVQVDKSAQ